MRDFQDTFEIRKRSFIGSISDYMTVPLSLVVFLRDPTSYFETPFLL